MSEAAKVLVVKMSSMGDIIHTLPALTDAQRALPGVRFDWVVEEAFAEIPAWHPAVDRVIPVAIRRWRKRPLRDFAGQEWRAARRAIRRDTYYRVVDAQGLIKSAVVTRLARGRRVGLDRHSAREGLAALAYDDRVEVSRAMHAVERTRSLFAQALDYPVPRTPADAGIAAAFEQPQAAPGPCIWFLHGTARAEKTWPESHWVELARLALRAGYALALTSGDAREGARAQRIADACAGMAGDAQVKVVPRGSLDTLAAQLAMASAAVAVDTGLGHLAAALAIPTVSLYGPTDPALIGTCGANQLHLAARSSGKSGKPGTMADLSAGQVWAQLQTLLSSRQPGPDEAGLMVQ